MGIFDLRSGKVDGNLVLDGAVRTRNGRQVGGVGFPGNQLNVLQMAEVDRTLQFPCCTRIYFSQALISCFI